MNYLWNSYIVHMYTYVTSSGNVKSRLKIIDKEMKKKNGLITRLQYHIIAVRLLDCTTFIVFFVCQEMRFREIILTDYRYVGFVSTR